MFKLVEKSESIFKRIRENKKMTKVELKLPKFKIESEISLVKFDKQNLNDMTILFWPQISHCLLLFLVLLSRI